MKTEESPNTIQKPVSDPTAKTIIIIGRMTAALVVLLAVAAFGLSYEALRDLAVVSGVINQKVAWLFPLIVDGGIVVFSLAALRASITGSDRRWFMSLVILVTVISIGLNIAHASYGLLSAVMAAMPPLLLFLAFESLMRQIHDSVIRQLPPKVRQAKPARTGKLTTILKIDDGNLRDRKERAAAMLSSGFSRNKIARELNVAPSTVRRYLADSKCA